MLLAVCPHRRIVFSVPPVSLAADCNWSARLTRAAQALASLKHPNIAHTNDPERILADLSVN